MSAHDTQPMLLATTDDINLCKTFECGQCFRWSLDEGGAYTGVAYGKPLRIWSSGNKIYCDAPDEELSFWRSYFDLDADYSDAIKRFTKPEYLKRCAKFGAGIRILRQEPWETLCSFIISQCNNIPRIKSIINTLCTLYGQELQPGCYSFPEPEIISPLSVEQLSPLRSGYRAQYILNAARAVTEGQVELDKLSALPSDEIFAKVTSIHGVGAKVANCFMLYGLHIMNRFPVDVWMKRALKTHFPPDFNPDTLGELSGLAQQYIFYYARSGGEGA